MIIGDGIVLGAGGESASIFVTGLSETDTVTSTKDGKTIAGKWMSKSNPASVVPDGYTQLEYIKSSGTQYIDTGFVPTLNTKAEFKITSSSTQPNLYPQLFGAQELSNGTNRFGINANWIARTGSTNMTASSDIRDTPREGSLEYNKYVLDGATYTATGSWTPADASLYLFNDHDAPGDYDGTVTLCSAAQFYYFKLYDNGTLVRDFIPAKRNSDSAIGLYDLVSGRFFTNSGTGVFTAGAEIPQYIDGFEIAPIKSYGTWTVTATDGTKTATSDVVVDSAIEYAVEMEYKLWLYKDGDECTDITGGWVVYTGDLTMTKNQTSLKITRNGSYGTIRPTNLISTIGYSTLKAQYSELSPSAGGFQILIYEEASPATSVKNEKIIGNASGEISLDVSGYQGNYYVGVGVAEYTQISGVLNRIWLE